MRLKDRIIVLHYQCFSQTKAGIWLDTCALIISQIIVFSLLKTDIFNDGTVPLLHEAKAIGPLLP